MSTASIKNWFNGLTPDKKRKVVVGGVLGLILVGVLLAVVATDDGPQTAANAPRKKKLDASILTGRDPQKVGIENITAATKRQEALIENLQRQVQALQNQQGAPRGGAPGGQGPTMPFPYAGAAAGQEVVALPGTQQDPAAKAAPGVPVPKASDRAVQQAVGGDPSAGGRGPQLPPPNIPGVTDNSDVFGAGPDGSSPSDAPPPTPKLKLRVLTPRQDAAADAGDSSATPQNAVFTQGGAQGRGAQSLSALARNAAPREQEYYIPMGAILSGTLLTGVDAPASGSAARKDPFPALFRIKHEAILPNAGLLDIRECFIVSSAYGDLSSERVYMRAEGLSCYRADGAIIEASMDAFASGSDGKAGIRGVVIEKTGALVARSLMAGFVSGMATAFKPQQAQQVAINQGGNSGSFVYPDVSYVLGNSLLGGASSAADRVATIYEDLARQIVPVVSVSAGIPVDFIMTRGATLRFKRVGEISATRVAASGQQGQRGGGDRPGDVTTSVTGSLGGPFSVTPGPGSSTPARAPTGSQTLSSGAGAGARP